MRRLISAREKLCFNCTGGQHRASECRSNRTCFNCKGKCHTSVCDKNANALTYLFQPGGCRSNLPTTYPIIYPITYPAVIVSVEGVKYRALIFTGAGASYVSSKFISLINKKPPRTETKTIKTLINTSSKKAPV